MAAEPIAPLAELQLRRYARQILLKEVGGRGQQRLLSRPVLLLEGGGAFSVAATYLAAGGTPLWLGSGVELGGFLEGASLEAFNPDTRPSAPPWLTLSGSARWETSAAVVLRPNGLAFFGPDGCRDCLEATLAALDGGPTAPTPPTGEVDEVALGGLGALVAQRLLLGLAEPLGALDLAEGRPRRREATRCVRHQ